MSILKILRPKPLIIHLLLPRAMYRFLIRKQILSQNNFSQYKGTESARKIHTFPGAFFIPQNKYLCKIK